MWRDHLSFLLTVGWGIGDGSLVYFANLSAYFITSHSRMGWKLYSLLVVWVSSSTLPSSRNRIWQFLVVQILIVGFLLKQITRGENDFFNMPIFKRNATKLRLNTCCICRNGIQNCMKHQIEEISFASNETSKKLDLIWDEPYLRRRSQE